MEHKNYIIHPYKFNMWIFILTMIMIFGGLTSAYIVSKSFTPPDRIVHFSLPDILKFNTLVVLFSSITMQLGINAAKGEDRKKALIFLSITFGLGLIFLIGQFNAFVHLTAGGLPFVDQTRTDNSVSFFYMFTGLHGLHIIGAVSALIILLYKTASNTFKSGGFFRSYEVLGTFWHFLGLLWVYLYVFLLYNQD